MAIYPELLGVSRVIGLCEFKGKKANTESLVACRGGGVDLGRDKGGWYILYQNIIYSQIIN